MKKTIVTAGDVYNRLTIVREIDQVRKYVRRFLCICVCGNEKEVDLPLLKSGQVKSCGCLLQEWLKRDQLKGNNYSWKGGRRVIDGGYIEIYKPSHPTSRSNGYIKEHRWVMEQYLGRPLLKNENVHHINGIRDDNRIENLELWSTSQPCGQRVKDKLEWCKEFIRQYDDLEK